MVRRYYRRYPRNNRDKYSVEQTFINMPPINQWAEIHYTADTLTSRQYSISVIPPSSTQGMRKVKHFTITFTDIPATLAYALVYVPEGYDPNIINYPADGKAISMYEPNQFVLSCGLVDANAGPCRINCPLSRNLNSGDSVYLICAFVDGVVQSNGGLVATVRYAITLQ